MDVIFNCKYWGWIVSKCQFTSIFNIGIAAIKISNDTKFVSSVEKNSQKLCSKQVNINIKVILISIVSQFYLINKTWKELKNKSDNENPFFSFIYSLYSIGFEGGIIVNLFIIWWCFCKHKMQTERWIDA